MEVNARVNYPIKNALRDMEQRGVIDMELEDTKFYVSSITLRVATVGMQRTVDAWNHHPIPGVYGSLKVTLQATTSPLLTFLSPWIDFLQHKTNNSILAFQFSIPTFI